ncbi:hypothetical protein T06_4080 [Trichinella sp. T6]|nr:hypothetical protein T06_4080 [Trichinella sp. T6]
MTVQRNPPVNTCATPPSDGRDGSPVGDKIGCWGTMCTNLEITDAVSQWFSKCGSRAVSGLGMDGWLIRKPVKREVAEMESQKGSTAGDVNNKRKIDENDGSQTFLGCDPLWTTISFRDPPACNAFFKRQGYISIADWERRNPVDPFMSNTGPPKPSKLFPKLKPRPFSYKILMSFGIWLGGPGLLSNSRIMSSAKAREETRPSLSVLFAFQNVLGKFCNATNVTNPVGVTPPAPMVLYGRGRRKNNTRIPSTRSSSRHMAALMGSERPRALTLTDGNGCLRRCAARQMAIARSRKAEGLLTSMVIWIADENSLFIRFDRAAH